MNLNPFAISGLLIVIMYLPLIFLLFLKGRDLFTRIYGFYLLAVTIWGAGALLIGITSDPITALKAWRFAYAGVLSIPVFFYHSVLLLTKRKSTFLLPLVYSQGIYFILSMFTGGMMSSARYLFNSFYFHVATPIFTLSFILWTIIISAAHTELICYFHKTYPEEKKQLQLILAATCVGFAGGITNFIPSYGINFYPYGNFLIALPSLAISYAILRHQFFDIRIVLKKSIAYSILILLMSLLYCYVILIFENILRGFWGYHSTATSVLTAFVIGIAFFPLHNQIQGFVDRIVFKKSTEEISKENELLRQEITKSEKLKAVATLASGMAHEIKNPLTAIKTFSEYLPQKLEDKEFLQKFSRIVGGEVNRIDALVNELLEFAKPSPLQLRKTNINKLISDTLDFLNSRFLQYNITVHAELPATNNNHIMLDPNKIKQVLLNIFLNAIEAMPKGGVLTVTTLNVEHRTSNDTMTITIADTGSGISKENLKHIFDPFFSTKDSGTGLGLPITHGIITEHGGTITAESVVGKGTTFLLTLPMLSDERGTSNKL